MRKSKYDLDSLIETFEEHSVEADKNFKVWKEQYDQLSEEGKKENPHLNEDFNLARALVAICREIEALKG